MPKKKSLKKPTAHFVTECKKIEEFIECTSFSKGVSDSHISWLYEHAIIRLYREFEQMLLECLVAGLNHDNTHLSQTNNLSLPKHLTDELCEYLIKGNRYFDFKGRKDIQKKCKRFLGDSHFLTDIFSETIHDRSLRKLIALRNFAAHDSSQSKKAALGACGLTRMGSSGSYLKKQNRLKLIIDDLIVLANKINEKASF